MEDRETITFGHVKVFFLGTLVGATVALLFAPKSGREMRGDIKERAGRLKTSVGENWQAVSARGRELVGNVTSRGREMYEKGAERIGDQKDRISAALSAGKNAAKDAYAGKGEGSAEDEA
ncbi:MAG: YtxH domain-containing protein [Acidobacteriota bacterium]